MPLKKLQAGVGPVVIEDDDCACSVKDEPAKKKAKQEIKQDPAAIENVIILEDDYDAIEEAREWEELGLAELLTDEEIEERIAYLECLGSFHVYMYICMYSYMCIYTCVYICVYRLYGEPQTGRYTYRHLHIHICMYAHVTSTCMHIYIYTYMCICMCVYVYM